MNNFLTRTLTGTVYVLVLLGSVFFIKPFLFAVLITFLIVIGIREFYKLLPEDKYQPLKVPGIINGLILFIVLFLYTIGYLDSLKYLLISVITTWLIFICELYRKKEFPFQNIAITLLPTFYIAFPLSLLYLTGFVDSGGEIGSRFEWQIILGFFILQWTSDTGAYLVGILFGKHPLFARISPKKSWEGFWGGVGFTILIARLLSLYFTNYTLTQWISIGVIIAVFGVWGDLIESLLKRSLNVKDSGTILPGHGGILDRFDSVIFSAPIVFLYLIFFS